MHHGHEKRRGDEDERAVSNPKTIRYGARAARAEQGVVELRIEACDWVMIRR